MERTMPIIALVLGYRLQPSTPEFDISVPAVFSNLNVNKCCCSSESTAHDISNTVIGEDPYSDHLCEDLVTLVQNVSIAPIEWEGFSDIQSLIEIDNDKAHKRLLADLPAEDDATGR